MTIWKFGSRLARIKDCTSMVDFESSCVFSFQALDWLQQSGDHYLATHTSPGATVAETQELLNQHREFCVSAKVRTCTNGAL